MTLLSQTATAKNLAFQDQVRDALMQTAANVYSEATTLTNNIKAGAVNPTLNLSAALGGAIAANTPIRVGGEILNCAAGALLGATAIVTSSTTVADHAMGEPVSPPTVAGHSARAVCARQVANNPDAAVVAWAAAVASDGTDGTVDATVVTRVSALWNLMAGA